MLRAGSVELSAARVPFVLVAMNIVYALSAYPTGVATDRMSPRTLLAVGLVALIVADLVLAATRSIVLFFGGVALYFPANPSHAGPSMMSTSIVSRCGP